MPIVHVLGYSSRRAGGLLETVSGLAGALQSHRVPVRAIGVSDAFFADDRYHWPCPIDVLPASSWAPGPLLYAPEMLQRLINLNPSLVFCHGLWCHHNRVVLQWARRTRRPYVVVPHGMLDVVDLRKSPLKKWIARQLYMEQLFQGAACVRAVSQSEADSIRAYGVRAPICLIPNGVALPPTADCEPPAWRRSLPPDAKVLFYIGRINPKKGLPALLDAWGQVKKSDPAAAGGWHLVIAGWDQNGHELSLKSRVDSLALGQTVHFTGPLFDAAKDSAFRHSNAFVLPSKSEGLPTVVLEAWAYEIPVLMTPQCNIPEGFTARAAIPIETNPASIAEGLRQLFLMGESERKAMAANGKALVAAKFSWQSIGAETVAICNWINGTGPQPACVITN